MVDFNTTLVRVIREKILLRHLQPGTWKLFHPDAKTPIDCPYGTISCAGSHATSLNYTTSLVHRLVNGTDIGLLTDEAYCNEHFSGVLCSQSSSGYYIDWSSRQSLACHVGTSSSLLLSLILCIPLALLLPIAICWTVGRKYRKSDKKGDDLPLLPRKVSSDDQNAFSFTAPTLLHTNGNFLVNKRAVACCTEAQYDQFADGNLHNSSLDLQRPATARTKRSSIGNSFLTCPDVHSTAPRDLESGPVIENPTTEVKIALKPLPEIIQWREQHFQQIRQSYATLGYLFKVKILVFSLQLTASLPSSIGIAYLPPVIASVLRIYSSISLVSPLAMIPTDCLGSLLGYGRPSLVLFMQIASSVPLLMLAALLAGYLFQTEFAFLNGILGRQYRDNLSRMALRYSSVAWMMTIILVAGVGQLALKCFTCVDIDPDRIFSSETQVLWNDPTVMCSDSNYNIGIVWATAASFTYILGVPLVMWIALRYSGFDHLVNISRSTKSAATSRAETGADNGSVSSDGGTGIGSTHDRYVDNDWRLDFSPSAYLNDSYALLHLSYRSGCIYWELLETVYRILIIAVLPYFTEKAGAAAHLFSIGATVFVYTLALWWLKPYNNSVNQNLAMMSSCQVLCFLVILWMILAIVESNGNGADGEVYLDLTMCVVAFLTPTMFLYQLIHSAYVSFYGSTDAKSKITIDLKFIPRDSDSSAKINRSNRSDLISKKETPSITAKDSKEKDLEYDDNVVYAFNDSSDDCDSAIGGKSKRSENGVSHAHRRAIGRAEPNMLDEIEGQKVNCGSDTDFSWKGRSDAVAMDHASDRRMDMTDAHFTSSPERVSEKVSGNFYYCNETHPEAMLLSARQRFDKVAKNSNICNENSSRLVELRGSSDCVESCESASNMDHSEINDGSIIKPADGSLVGPSSNSKIHVKHRRNLAADGDGNGQERGYQQIVVKGVAGVDCQWISLKKSTRRSIAGDNEGEDAERGVNPSARSEVKPQIQSKKKSITAYFNPFGAWNDKDTKLSFLLSPSSATSLSTKVANAQTPSSQAQDTERWSDQRVHTTKRFFPGDRDEQEVSDGSYCGPADGSLVGPSTNNIRHRRDLAADGEGNERGYKEMVVKGGAEDEVSPWFSLKKSTRRSVAGDNDESVVKGEDDEPQIQSKKKLITAYFNPFGAWNEKDTKFFTPLSMSSAATSTKIANAQTPSDQAQKAKRFFPGDHDEQEVSDGSYCGPADGSLVGPSKNSKNNIRHRRDFAADGEGNERGYKQMVVKGGAEDEESPWFSLKKSTRRSIAGDNDDNDKGEDAERGVNPSALSEAEPQIQSKKKSITAYFNPFGAWNDKDTKSSTPLSTSSEAASIKKVANAQTPSSQAQDTERWSDQRVHTAKRFFPGDHGEQEVSDESYCGPADGSLVGPSTNNIRHRRDLAADGNGNERGYKEMVVKGGAEDEVSPWFSLKKSTRRSIAGDNDENVVEGEDVERGVNPSALSEVEPQIQSKKKSITAYFNPFGAWNEKDTKSSTPSSPSSATSLSTKVANAQTPSAQAQGTERWASGVHKVKQVVVNNRNACEIVDSGINDSGNGTEGCLVEVSGDESIRIKQKRERCQNDHRDFERGYVQVVVSGGVEDDNPWFSLKKSTKMPTICNEEDADEEEGCGGEVNLLPQQTLLPERLAVESESHATKKPATAYQNPFGAWNEKGMKSFNSSSMNPPSSRPVAISPRTISKAMTPVVKSQDTIKWASEVHTGKEPISDDEDNDNDDSARRNRHRRRNSIPYNFKLLQSPEIDARHLKRNASSTSFYL